MRRIGVLWRYPAALVVLGILTYCGVFLHLTLQTISLLYLLIVILAALFRGFWLGTFTSCVSVVCLDYFFTPPLLSLRVSDAPGHVALLTFEVAALIVSSLSARARKQARVAAEERINIKRLYEMSQSALMLDLHNAPAPDLARIILRTFEVRAVAIFDENACVVGKSGDWKSGEVEGTFEYLHRNSPAGVGRAGCLQRMLRIGDQNLGTLVVSGDLRPPVIDAVASLAANALDHNEKAQKDSEAVSARQTEQLRKAVLDALAHDFKTPLTAIRAASSGLIEMGGLTQLQAGMVTLIDSEVTLLNEHCTRLLQAARLHPDPSEAPRGDNEPL